MKRTALGALIHVKYVLNVHATSDSDRKLSDKERIESSEFPVCSVPKPGMVVVSGKTSGKSDFPYIGVR